MKHIVLCRIDDRLIHGQVVTAWVKQTEGNRIVIIDEALVDKVILGGMGAKSGRRKFNRNVSASEEEIECMQRIMNKHIPMYYQLVPNESPSDVGKMISG